MTDKEAAPREDGPRKNGIWASRVDHLEARFNPQGGINLNVDGRPLTGPLQGFGQLWQKTYRVRLEGSPVTPAELIAVWKEKFPSFWPKGNNFYAPLTGIQAGEVALLNLAGPGGMTVPGGYPLISTGVMVVYTDDESFAFMTPQGHMFGAIITFSGIEEECTVAQIQALVRASDPLFELMFRLGVGHRMEDQFWQDTLRQLAAYFGVNGAVAQQVALLDPRVQWSEARNIWSNSALRTAAYYTGAPFRWARRKIMGEKKQAG